MNQRAEIPRPLAGTALARAVSDWLRLGAAVEIAPDGTIKVKPTAVAAMDSLDLVDFKR